MRAEEKSGSDQGAAASAKARTQRSSTAGVLETSIELAHSRPTANATVAASTRLFVRLPMCLVHCSAALWTGIPALSLAN